MPATLPNVLSPSTQARLPPGLAFSLWRIGAAREGVARFDAVISAYEHLTHHLALTGLAMYCTRRPTGGITSLETVLSGLSKPSFGAWARILRRLDHQLEQQLQFNFYGLALCQRLRSKAFRTARGMVQPNEPKRVTPLDVIDTVVTLRNRAAHRQASDRECERMVDPLLFAMGDLIDRLDTFLSRPLMAVRHMHYFDRDHYEVDYYELRGTGAPELGRRRIEDPLNLRPDRCYLANREKTEFIDLEPFVRVGNADEVWMLQEFSEATVTYERCIRDAGQGTDADTIALFKRAPFLRLLHQPDAVELARREYEDLVLQALEDGVVTEDELALLRVAAHQKQLTPDMIEQVHVDLGLRVEDDDYPEESAETLVGETALPTVVDGRASTDLVLLQKGEHPARLRALLVSRCMLSEEEADALLSEGFGTIARQLPPSFAHELRVLLEETGATVSAGSLGG